MQIPSFSDVVRAMEARSYEVFRGKRAPDVNLVGLRAVPGTIDTFDDLLLTFWRDPASPEGEDRWLGSAWPCTLDPGKPSLEHPSRADGTADMAIGQVRHAFKRGWHHPGTAGAYPCLVPALPIPVNRYRTLADFLLGKGELSSSWSTQIHHANSVHPSTIVGAWSEGCCVLADARHLSELLAIYDRNVAAHNGDTLTITIIEWPRG